MAFTERPFRSPQDPSIPSTSTLPEPPPARRTRILRPMVRGGRGSPGTLVGLVALGLLGLASLAAPVGLSSASAARPPDDQVTILCLEDRRERPVRLLPFLAAARAETRARACLAIGRIAGPASDPLPPGLLSALGQRLRHDPAPRVRAAAAFALGLLATPAAAPWLAAHLVDGGEPVPAVRARAVAALGACDPDPHPRALAVALEDPDAQVVHAALLSVWRATRGLQLERLLTLSHAPQEETRWRAAYALMRMLGAPAAGRTPVAGGGRLDREQRRAVLERLLVLAADPIVAVRLPALRALGRDDLPDDLRRRALTALEGTWAAEDVRVRVEAVRTMGRLHAGSGHWPTQARATTDPHPHVRIAAWRAAGRILETPALIAALGPALDAPLAWERGVALETTCASCRESGLFAQALHLIRRGLADPAWEVRATAAAALAELAEAWRAEGSSTSGQALLLETLRPVLADDPRVLKMLLPTWVASLARDSLATETCAARAWGEIDRWLAHPDEILQALVWEGARQAVPADSEDAAGTRGAPGNVAGRGWILRARQALSSPSGDVRASIHGLLGALLAGAEREAAAELLLQAARQDPERPLRVAAIEALRAAAHPTDPWTPQVPGLTAGPQETSWDEDVYQAVRQAAARARTAVLTTDAGELRLALFGREAPLTVYNFAQLAESGYFDGGAWHRVVPDFVVQDGCPRHDGWGGPGYTIRCEINPQPYQVGTLGMALSGKDTGGSQFFLTLSAQPHLDGRYTVFGQLIDGLAALEGIAQGARIERVRIEYADAPGARPDRSSP